MSEWHTVASAANWLADHIGVRNYSAEQLWRAIQQKKLQAHYWPVEPVTLGLFDLANQTTHLNAPEYLNSTEEEFAYPLRAVISGPVPFDDYTSFSVSMAFTLDPELATWNDYVGINVRDLFQSSPIGVCLAVDEMGHPLSLADIDFVVLVHTDILLAYHQNLPASRELAPVMEVSKYGDDGKELQNWVARCAQTGGSIPFAEQREHLTDDEHSEPMLRTLALAAHVIADLAEKLDQKESKPGLHLNLRIDGRPNTRGIAMKLSDTAKELNYSGYGAGHRGFEERLRKALKTIS
ncbi:MULTISPECIES: hypothetical protein [unclassified Pseudomonas]|uniref:hypothetical protein n=1 Tax=unclassified Pseudomonas TaxID=196821 RepID=UPI000C87C7D6|nr:MULTISPECIES: hypothetical protein [unclassified Pseudomonas]PMU11729.1 hypothetical protein C1Y11_04130 [Pseudomonas sp. FW305-20]PMU15383.1 hypothetical protein C1Y10_22440 [Pseudomonas sp. FW305-122]PMU43226.1 hypothetical protein C1Y12_03395 [Pseudomonas sp. FW305-47B]PMX63517.1 hypothetical protein C1X12_22580 [Pseudomonas sp. FW305-60]PMX64551.1 hypothetical protein C1Y13_04190 [Pseudomonas sp. FW305-33]